MALVPHPALNLVTWAAVGGTALHALARGGLSERVAASAVGATAIISAVIQRAEWSQWTWAGTLACDAVLTVSLLSVALLSTRWWPLWATAAQALATISLAATPLLPIGRGNPFFYGELLWEALLVAAMNIGIAAEARRSPLRAVRKGYGPDRRRAGT